MSTFNPMALQALLAQAAVAGPPVAPPGVVPFVPPTRPPAAPPPAPVPTPPTQAPPAAAQAGGAPAEFDTTQMLQKIWSELNSDTPYGPERLSPEGRAMWEQAYGKSPLEGLGEPSPVPQANPPKRFPKTQAALKMFLLTQAANGNPAAARMVEYVDQRDQLAFENANKQYAMEEQARRGKREEAIASSVWNRDKFEALDKLQDHDTRRFARAEAAIKLVQSMQKSLTAKISFAELGRMLDDPDLAQLEGSVDADEALRLLAQYKIAGIGADKAYAAQDAMDRRAQRNQNMRWFLESGKAEERTATEARAEAAASLYGDAWNAYLAKHGYRDEESVPSRQLERISKIFKNTYKAPDEKALLNYAASNPRLLAALQKQRTLTQLPREAFADDPFMQAQWDRENAAFQAASTSAAPAGAPVLGF